MVETMADRDTEFGDSTRSPEPSKSIERVRDILFGARHRETERRLHSIERQQDAAVDLLEQRLLTLVEDLESVKDRLAHAEKALESTSTALTKTQHQLTTALGRLDGTQRELAEAQRRLTAYETKTNAITGAVDRATSAATERVDGVEHQLNERLSVIDRRFSTSDAKLADLHTKADGAVDRRSLSNLLTELADRLASPKGD